MAAAFLVGVVAVLQFAIMLLEMVFWDTPTGHRLFKMSGQTSQIAPTHRVRSRRFR